MRTTTTLFGMAALLGLSAQTTALNFTADDCGGTAHDLFSELDAGNAVIIDLVMMGCQPCVTASNSIIDNVLPNTSDPSRVKFYSIGYTNSISCSQITSWQQNNGFEHPVFAGMSAQTTYYGGMGMPTVVVLGGGSAHTVYYAEQGHDDAENPEIIAALNEALANSIGIPERTATNVVLSPNPALDVVTITGGTWTSARVLDLQGKELMNAPVLNSRLQVRDLHAGTYVMVLTAANGQQVTQRFEKR
jgi:hypothetical protein